MLTKTGIIQYTHFSNEYAERAASPYLGIFKYCSHVHHGDCRLLHLRQAHFSKSYLNISNGSVALLGIAQRTRKQRRLTLQNNNNHNKSKEMEQL